MKRTISLWPGLLAFALLPAIAQTPAPTPALKGPTGTIHGHVNGPEGASRTAGTVSLSNDEGHTSKFSFPVTATGDYTGVATPGTYTVIFRAPDTPAGQMVDSIEDVKIVAGQDVLQNIDMTRKEFIDKMTPDEKKQLEELKKKNKDILSKNEIIKGLNADLLAANQDFSDANNASATAKAALDASASKADIDAKAEEIRTAKYTDVETMMLKDTAVKPDASALWAQLGQAQVGLKKYDEAEASFKKVLEVEAAAKKPDIRVQGTANAGLGEAYARNGKVPEANAAYDAAAKINPAQAAFYLKNEAIIFFQMNNTDAQVAAADEAIKADPTIPILYYLKGNGLVGKSVPDPKTNMLVAPPGCVEAYKKYLELAPNGQYAADVKSILAAFQTALPPAASPGKSGKKKGN